MKLLWLSNMIPGIVEKTRSGGTDGGLWMDRTLEDLLLAGEEVFLLCRGPKGEAGQIEDRCRYMLIGEEPPEQYDAELTETFREILREYQPDLIHIWGTEYGHCLSMVNAAEKEQMLDRLVISLQGICSAICKHYADGIPQNIRKRKTLRDHLRGDSILRQQEKFALRAEHETAALRKARHVIGRTDFDRAMVRTVNPEIRYHFCNETLRLPFYQGAWQYAACDRHRIFAPGCQYPVKGFHTLLMAMPKILESCPDAVISVPGRSFLSPPGLKAVLHRSSYQKYLAELTGKYHLEHKIRFLGGLTGEKMKEAYLRCQVFALPSTIENSSNSLGEAMLLGVPCAACDVGGVKTMLDGSREGRICSASDPDALAAAVTDLFSLEEKAEKLGAAAAAHGKKTHNAEENLTTLREIYSTIQKTGE